ncbi:MAG: hypothetical protein ACOX04_08630 [Candidatus Scatomorpha sp.]|jgi:hypothetical protein
MANIKANGIDFEAPRTKKYIEDFLKVLPTLPKKEQEAVQKIKDKYKGQSQNVQKYKLLDLARSYLEEGVTPTTCWDFEDMF